MANLDPASEEVASAAGNRPRPRTGNSQRQAGNRGNSGEIRAHKACEKVVIGPRRDNPGERAGRLGDAVSIARVLLVGDNLVRVELVLHQVEGSGFAAQILPARAGCGRAKARLLLVCQTLELALFNSHRLSSVNLRFKAHPHRQKIEVVLGARGADLRGCGDKHGHAGCGVCAGKGEGRANCLCAGCGGCGAGA